jgi:hypothetical protein
MKMAPRGGKSPLTRDNALQPHIGIEPMTYELRAGPADDGGGGWCRLTLGESLQSLAGDGR